MNSNGWQPYNLKMKESLRTPAKENLSSGFAVTFDGLACFTGVIDAGCQHRPIIIAGGRKPKDLP